MSINIGYNRYQGGSEQCTAVYLSSEVTLVPIVLTPCIASASTSSAQLWNLNKQMQQWLMLVWSVMVLALRCCVKGVTPTPKKPSLPILVWKVKDLIEGATFGNKLGINSIARFLLCKSWQLFSNSPQLLLLFQLQSNFAQGHLLIFYWWSFWPKNWTKEGKKGKSVNFANLLQRWYLTSDCDSSRVVVGWGNRGRLVKRAKRWKLPNQLRKWLAPR